jgi:hypothetical protein
MAQFDSIRFQPSRPLLKEVSADRLNAILSEIKKNRPRGERGITVRQAGDATYIGLAASLKGGNAAAPPQPWDLIATQDPDNENQYKLKVQPGTLSGILPSNWDEEFTCADTGLFYAKAVIATDGEAISAVTIEIDSTAPTAQTPAKFGIATSVEYVFGLFSEGAIYRPIGDGHITLSTRTWLVTTASPAAQPGESPYDFYFLLL